MYSGSKEGEHATKRGQRLRRSHAQNIYCESDELTIWNGWNWYL